MKNIKKTKRDFYNEILLVKAIAENEELTNFVKHEIELLEKKKSNKKMTKAQEENEMIKTQIFTIMEEKGGKMTIKDLQAYPSMKDFTNQKLSALVKQMIDENLVIRTEEKRVAYFQVFTVE